jgi:hypothetical protein
LAEPTGNGAGSPPRRERVGTRWVGAAIAQGPSLGVTVPVTGPSTHLTVPTRSSSEYWCHGLSHLVERVTGYH